MEYYPKRAFEWFKAFIINCLKMVNYSTLFTLSFYSRVKTKTKKCIYKLL